MSAVGKGVPDCPEFIFQLNLVAYCVFKLGELFHFSP
jgi:hypothetical protein